MQWIEIIEQAGTEHDMRFGESGTGLEFVTDSELAETFACEHIHALLLSTRSKLIVKLTSTRKQFPLPE